MMTGVKWIKNVTVILFVFLLTLLGTENISYNNSNRKAGGQLKNDPPLPPYHLIWYHAHAPQKDTPLVLKEVNKYLKQKINATLEIRMVEEADYDKKMKAVISSGEKFDICFTSVWMNSYVQNVLRGSFRELDPLLEKYGQRTLTALTPLLLEGARVRGKLYALPVNKELPSQWGITFNKKYMDKYGLNPASVSKIADLEPLLKMIKKNEPGVVPYLIYPYSCHAFSMPLERVEEQVPSALYFDNRTHYRLVNPLETPEFKEYLSLMRRWYQAGYILEDAASLSEVYDIEESGRWFAGSMAYDPLTASLISNQFGYPVLVVPIGEPVITKKDTEFHLLAISSASRNPERAMMFLELLNSDQYLYNLLVYGIAGVHYQKLSGNIIKLRGNSYYIQPYTFGNMKLLYSLPFYPKTLAKDYQTFNAAAIRSPLLRFHFNPEPVKLEIEKITEVTEECEGPLFVGAVDPKEYLPKVIKKYLAAGLDKVMVEQQRQLDTWLRETGAEGK
ncbi:MAG TPA: ABC transporter substrate-binding protein [Bacillota bacterium]|nr:ABC transporter substrate-binding protein [Bacillota bacterium]